MVEIPLIVANRECQIFCKWDWQEEKGKFKLLWSYDPKENSYIRKETDWSGVEQLVEDTRKTHDKLFPLVKEYLQKHLDFENSLTSNQKFYYNLGYIEGRKWTKAEIKTAVLQTIMEYLLKKTDIDKFIKLTHMVRVDEKAWEWMIEAFTYNINYLWSLKDKHEFRDLVGQKWHNLKEIITSNWFNLAPSMYKK